MAREERGLQLWLESRDADCVVQRAIAKSSASIDCAGARCHIDSGVFTGIKSGRNGFGMDDLDKTPFGGDSAGGCRDEESRSLWRSWAKIQPMGL